MAGRALDVASGRSILSAVEAAVPSLAQLIRQAEGGSSPSWRHPHFGFSLPPFPLLFAGVHTGRAWRLVGVLRPQPFIPPVLRFRSKPSGCVCFAVSPLPYRILILRDERRHSALARVAPELFSRERALVLHGNH